ncbi:MAG: type IV secretory system conjugative DNA transfer family protein [Martelella sp.]|uniref:type IV secretory system conjugative DNA transfer family protein n=1 Tax=Martelella sp. TaxID=1969699 RepID=UPI003242D14A
MLNSLETRWRYVLATAAGIIAGGYIGSMVATAYYMLIRGQDLNTINPLKPWFFAYPLYEVRSVSSVYDFILMLTFGTMALFTIIALAGVHRGTLTQYDNAHFQTKAEIRKNRMQKGFAQNGFIFGKAGRPKSSAPFFSAEPGRFPHIMLIAPTGRGKGVGFVIPNLLHFAGSTIVLDVKGENFEKTAVHRQEGLKNRVWYFSPFDYIDHPDQKDQDKPERVTRTHRFNPLARIAAMSSIDEQYTALNTLADQFLVVEGEGAKGFYQAGKKLFVASCLFAIEQGNPTLGYASEIMGGGGIRAESYRRYADQTKIPSVSRTFNEAAGETQKIVDSYISVINGAGFELWNDPSVVRATSESDFDFATFRKEQQSLYIVVQSGHLKTLAPLIRLLFADAIASLQQKEPGEDEPYTVMFLMDEFDQLGRQPMVLQSIKTIRSFGGRFFIITQSIAGLDSPKLYGQEDRRSLIAGAGLQIYMTPQDDRTAQVLSDALGKETITAVSQSENRIRKMTDSANVSRRSEERPLISPSKLLRFPLDKVLILPEGQYPIKADHVKYYEDRHFAPIDKARIGHKLPYPPVTESRKKIATIAGLQNRPEKKRDPVELLQEQRSTMEAISKKALAKQKPKRQRAKFKAEDLPKFDDEDGQVRATEPVNGEPDTNEAPAVATAGDQANQEPEKKERKSRRRKIDPEKFAAIAGDDGSAPAEDPGSAEEDENSHIPF